MDVIRQQVTAEELLHMSGDGFRYGLVRGELRRMTPAGSEHGRIAMSFGAAITGNPLCTRVDGGTLIVPQYDTIKLSSKHRKTLKAIFENPVRSNVAWTDVEKLLMALGAEIGEGRGSRVRVYLSGVRAVFHRPHPQRETDKGALKSVRRFLVEVGIGPEE